MTCGQAVPKYLAIIGGATEFWTGVAYDYILKLFQNQLEIF